MGAQERHQFVMREFACWDRLSSVQRAELGLPPSVRAFARSYAVHDRTLSKWRSTQKWARFNEDVIDGAHDGDVVAALAAVRAEVARKAKLTPMSSPLGKVSPVATGGTAAQQVMDAVTDPTVVDADELTGDEADYAKIKRVLVLEAISGDPKSQTLYFQTFGKHLVEAEKQRRLQGFEDLDDAALLDRMVDLVPIRDLLDAVFRRLAPDDDRVQLLQLSGLTAMADGV